MTTADAPHPHRDVVLVSGLPGAGKSTLAGPLAAELGFALLSKDRIKETLHDVLNDAWRDPGTAADLAWTRSLGAASMELIWTLAGQAAQVVLEANFRPHSEYERGKIARLVAGGGRLAEVYCQCPAPVAAARYAARAAHRHPVHVVPTLSAGFMAEFDQPVGLGELIEVNTLAQVDVVALARDVRARLGAAATGVAAGAAGTGAAGTGAAGTGAAGTGAAGTGAAGTGAAGTGAAVAAAEPAVG